MSYESCSENFSQAKPFLLQYETEVLNEADTRLKIIDEILFNCLGWDKDKVTVESHVHDGYVDYKLGTQGHRFIIEAKKVGRSFQFPNTFGYESNLTVAART